MRSLQTRTPGRAIRWALVALVLIQLLSQTLGLMHRVVHSELAPLGHDILAARQAAAPDRTGQPHAHNPTHAHDADCAHGNTWVAHLFDHHSDDSDCRLMDASNGFDMLFEPLALMEYGQSAPLFIAFMSVRAAVAALAPFEARAPPATR